MSNYRAQAADIQLAALEDIAACPGIVAAIDAAGASVAALVHAAELDLASRLTESTRRTESLPSMRTSIVQPRGFLSRGTEADAYEVLRGGPNGAPESLKARIREQHAAADERRASGQLTHKQLRAMARNKRR